MMGYLWEHMMDKQMVYQREPRMGTPTVRMMDYYMKENGLGWI